MCNHRRGFNRDEGRVGGAGKGSPPQYALLIRERKGNKALRLLARKTNGTAAAVIPEGPTSFLYVYIRVCIYISTSADHWIFPPETRCFRFLADLFILNYFFSLSLAPRQIPPAATDPIVFSLLNRLGRSARGRSKLNIYFIYILFHTVDAAANLQITMYRVRTAQM